MRQPGTKAKPARILWRGRSLTVPEACALAVQEHRANRPEAAVELFGLVLAAAPNYVEGYNNRGVILQQMQRNEAALSDYDRAVALKPDYITAHFNRGTVLKKLRRSEEALAAYERVLAIQPGHFEAHNNVGVIWQELKRYDQALASYDRVVSLNPNHSVAWNNRGIVLTSQGNMAEAEKSFRRASELRPVFPDPLFNLAHIRHYTTPDDPDVQKVRALLESSGISPETREHLYFTLGKIHDDCGQYDEAFGYFRQGNEIRNGFVSYDARRVERMTADLQKVFTAEFANTPADGASDSVVPIFIVGMPRSGTTLMASILSNHPLIATAGELSTLGDYTASLRALTGGQSEYPAAVRELNPDAVGKITTGYEQRLRRDAPAGTRHVIDKNPLNFRHVGLIARLFPRARIIHCTRNPLATGLSNYFQRFPLHLDYSFDLKNIGHFHGEYDRLMKHWRAIGISRLAEVSYEEMIQDTEAVARRLLDFIGVEWDERCLAPHTNRAPVETASHWQVRQPIYRHSIDGWRHYEKYLEPLKTSLAAAGVDLTDRGV
jgi:tetratricopeptide (TPR) repeat protein